ncbi:uncharacterized protein LOC123878096 isoform X3 [Maniola jurtina]|nr:uncharacterized protein LOC123878096 isoform X3 [Maniola jurtina]
MEFTTKNGIENNNTGMININSYEYLKTSPQIAVNDVTPIISQITNFEENGRMQSSVPLSDVTLSSFNQCSRHRVSVCNQSSEKSFTNSLTVFLKDVIEENYTNALIPQTQEILFSSPKRCKKLRRKKLLQTLNKRKFRIIPFNYKHREQNIKRKLKTYSKKTKRNYSHPRQIQQELRINSVLKVVSRTRILKKVLSKANLLDQAGITFLKDVNQDKILHTDASDDTLTRINSESSQNDSTSTKTVPSVVEIPTKMSASEPASTHTLIQTQNVSLESQPSNETTCIHENKIYPINNSTEESRHEIIVKTDIISVAVAQINDASILKYQTGVSSEQSREEMLYKENLTSAESFNTESDTAKMSSLEITEKDAKNNHLLANNDDKNCIVLTDMINTFGKSSTATLNIAKTSSYFTDNSDSLDIFSNETLTPSSKLTNQTEPCIYYKPTRNGEEVKCTLLDTIINVEMFKMPITSSENEYSTRNSNNIIITDELGKMPFPNKVQAIDKYSKNVIQKSFSVDNEGDRPKNVILPNEDTIRSIITETEKPDKKSCSEEFRNFVPPQEMLDKLIVYFDMRIRRLEDSLVKQIRNELKESLTKFEKYFPSSLDENDFLRNGNIYNNVNESDISKMESGRLTYFDESMQCDLVQNEAIDELIKKSKMKVEGNTVIVEDFPLKLIKSRVKIKKVNDSFEIIKSVRPCTSEGRGKGDSLLTLSSEGVGVKKLNDFHQRNRLVKYVLAPINFFKANVLVITSVPAFFVFIFLVYRFFLLLI